MILAFAGAGAVLTRIGHVAWRIVRGKKEIKKRWSPTFFVNMVSAMVIVGVLLAEVVFSSFKIGMAPTIRCTEGDVFFVSRVKPEHLVKGELYSFSGLGFGEEFGFGFTSADTMTKYLAALPGDQVKVDASGISINGVWWGGINPQTLEKLDLSIEDITRTFVVEEGQMLMLGTLARSVDGRYIGTVPQDKLIGRTWRIY